MKAIYGVFSVISTVVGALFLLIGLAPDGVRDLITPGAILLAGVTIGLSIQTSRQDAKRRPGSSAG